MKKKLKNYTKITSSCEEICPLMTWDHAKAMFSAKRQSIFHQNTQFIWNRNQFWCECWQKRGKHSFWTQKGIRTGLSVNVLWLLMIGVEWLLAHYGFFGVQTISEATRPFTFGQKIFFRFLDTNLALHKAPKPNLLIPMASRCIYGHIRPFLWLPGSSASIYWYSTPVLRRLLAFP